VWKLKVLNSITPPVLPIVSSNAEEEVTVTERGSAFADNELDFLFL
jgi:hypothetical protein